MRQGPRWRRLALPLLAAVMALGACNRDVDDAPEPSSVALASAPRSARPVDVALLAFLSAARSAHHRADLLEARGSAGAGADEPGRRGAIEALRAFLRAFAAGPVASAPEAREVLADTHARLADLHSLEGDRTAALDQVERGLRLVPGTSYFRGHLLEIRGLTEEREARRLAEQGDADGAADARARALTAFQAAMRVQAAVIRGATSNDAPPPPMAAAEAAPEATEGDAAASARPRRTTGAPAAATPLGAFGPGRRSPAKVAAPKSAPAQAPASKPASRARPAPAAPPKPGQDASEGDEPPSASAPVDASEDF